MLRILDCGAEFAWNGADAVRPVSPTGTAPLLRRVMPELPAYEAAGYNTFEVPQPDRRLLK